MESKYEPPKYYMHEFNGFGRLFKLGGDELRNRVTNEASTNSLVVALFLTISIPAFIGGAPSSATQSQTTGYIFLWGASIFCQMLSLILSVRIMTAINKCGTDKAVIDLVKYIQKPGICTGGTAFYVAIIQWIVTLSASIYTAFIQYQDQQAVLVFLSLMGVVLIMLAFYGNIVPEYHDDLNFEKDNAIQVKPVRISAQS